MNMSLIDKIHIYSDSNKGSVLSGLTEPVLFTSNLDKPYGYRVVCNPEKILHRKVNKSVSRDTIFSLEVKISPKLISMLKVWPLFDY